MAGHVFKKRNVVQRSIAEHLQDCMRSIKEAFPDGTKLTLVIRAPSLTDPVIMTNDQPEETINAIRKMQPGKPGLFIQ